MNEPSKLQSSNLDIALLHLSRELIGCSNCNLHTLILLHSSYNLIIANF